MRLLLSMVVFFGAMLFGAEVNWAASYVKAQERAEAEGKNIYLKITTKECPWCRRLEKYTLSDEDVVKRLNTSYVSVQVTRGEDEYPEYFSAKMVPMNYIVTPAGEEVYSALGFMDFEEFLTMLDDAEQAYKEMKKEKQ